MRLSNALLVFALDFWINTIFVNSFFTGKSNQELRSCAGFSKCCTQSNAFV